MFRRRPFLKSSLSFGRSFRKADYAYASAPSGFEGQLELKSASLVDDEDNYRSTVPAMAVGQTQVVS